MESTESGFLWIQQTLKMEASNRVHSSIFVVFRDTTHKNMKTVDSEGKKNVTDMSSLFI